MTNFFGQRGYFHNPKDPWVENFEEALETLDELIKAGKIRKIGISNEAPWGLMRYLELSKKGLPKNHYYSKSIFTSYSCF